MSHINIRCVRIASRLAFFRHRPAINESRGLISHAGRIAGLASMRKAMRVCLRCGNKEIGSGSRKKKSERYFVILEFLFILWHSQKTRYERKKVYSYLSDDRETQYDIRLLVSCALSAVSTFTLAHTKKSLSRAIVVDDEKKAKVRANLNSTQAAAERKKTRQFITFHDDDRRGLGTAVRCDFNFELKSGIFFLDNCFFFLFSSLRLWTIQPARRWCCRPLKH